MRPFITLLFTAAALLAEDYKAAPGGAPPAELAASVSALLHKEGTRVMKDGQLLAEVWYRSEVPAGPASTEANLTMPNVPHGSLLAVIQFAQKHEDRRGQTVQPGIYTMRYSYFPENGTHQGAAPQRDFLLLVQAAGDTEGASTPAFDALLALSRKASGTPHPAVFSIWKEDPKYFKEGQMEKQGEHDWVLMRKMGVVPVSMILAGRGE
ncbi:MAG: hypothetical protein ACK58M_20080 [Acidobacteriota bacterium]|jgi:hypothetical protein|nr:hypothetical protein [Acidobacteriaceae bacterium]